MGRRFLLTALAVAALGAAAQDYARDKRLEAEIVPGLLHMRLFDFRGHDGAPATAIADWLDAGLR